MPKDKMQGSKKAIKKMGNTKKGVNPLNAARIRQTKAKGQMESAGAYKKYGRTLGTQAFGENAFNKPSYVKAKPGARKSEYRAEKGIKYDPTLTYNERNKLESKGNAYITAGIMKGTKGMQSYGEATRTTRRVKTAVAKRAAVKKSSKKK